MKTVSNAFMTMLQTSEYLVEADLYTITLQNGTVLRYTSAQLPVTYNGNTYDAAAAPIQSVTATAQPFFTGDGSTTSAHLVGPNGESITSAATVTAIHQTDWQGRQLLYPTARTNALINSQCDHRFVARGLSTPPIVVDYATFDDASCTAVTFDATMTGVGYGNCRAEGSAISNAFVPGGQLYGWSMYVGLSRALTGSEHIVVYFTGSAGTSVLDLTASSCAPFVGKRALATGFNQNNPNGNGNNYPVVYLAQVVSSPVTVYVSDGMVFIGAAAVPFGAYIPTTTAPVTVTDYAVDAAGNVTLGQAPEVGATLDWDGSGSTGNYAPGFVRGNTKCAVGLQSDDLEVDVLFDGTTLINGISAPAFASAGGFDNAVLRLDKALAPDWSNPVVNGVVNLFAGYVGEVKIEQGKITLTVKSRLKIMNTSFPRNYYLPQDNNTLFTPASGLSASSYQVSGTVQSGNITLTSFNSNCTNPDGWFALGSVTWTSGGNKGLRCFVKASANASGAFTLAYPLAAVPAVGDTFTALPGYDRTQTTCHTKFNNLANFRGYPYVPTPETLDLGQAGSPPTANGGGGGGGIGGMGRGPGGQIGRIAVE